MQLENPPVGARDDERLAQSFALHNAAAILLAREQANDELRASRDHIASILESITDGFIVLDDAWRIAYVNRKAAEILGAMGKTADELIGADFWQAFPDTQNTRMERAYRRALGEQVTIEIEVFYPPLGKWFEVRAYPSPGALSIFFQDVTRRKDAESLLAYERRILELVATGDDLHRVLDALCREIQSLSLSDMRASVLLLDATGTRLSHGAAPSLPPAYNDAIDGLTVGPGVGSCGTAAYERRPVDVTDIANDPRWQDFHELAAEHGLAACCSMPIMSSRGELLGTMAMYFDRPTTPSERDRALIASGTRLAGIVIERDRAEESIRERDERLTAMFEQAAVGIAFAATDGRLQSVNRRFAELIGYPLEEVTSMTIFDITHPADRDDTRRLARTLLHGEANHYQHEKRYVRKDGTVFWSLTTVTLLKDADGKGARCLGVIEDITRRKQVEMSLERSEQFSRSIVESSLDCIKTLSLSGELLWINARGLHALGVDDGQTVVGRSYIDMWNGEDRARAVEAVAAAAAGGIGKFLGFFPVHGAEHWWNVVITPILDAEGRPESLLAVSRDVTERIAAERRLRDAARDREALLESERSARAVAEHASRMKDEFLATLSHELRTPLSSILGWAHVLRRGKASTADLETGLEAIERNARTQTRLIEDLLDMSRIVSGKVRLDVQPVDPTSFIEAAIETVRPAALAKSIHIDSFLDPGPFTVSGDPARLQQVVWNLLSNAIKFTPKEGRVQIVLERVDAQIEISVSDTGVGIHPDFLEHVFERFRQADSSTTRRYGGLGLGLAIVKHLVELHGGSVRAMSAGEGLGATFAVRLPARMVARDGRGGVDRSQSSAAVEAGMTDFHPDLGGVRVLVVDDQDDARELVERVIAECNADVRGCRSGEEALALVESFRPAVLVSDIGMPGMDGYELLRRVRALGAERGGRMPAVALTAFARSEDRMRALRAGYLVHLPKPVEPAELVATVASLTVWGQALPGQAQTGLAR